MGKQPTAGRKTKEAIARAAASSSKQGKKKWTKGRVRDKVVNAVFFDEALYKRVSVDVPKMKLITVATLMDRFKLNGSLARVLIKHMVQKGAIKVVGQHHHAMYIYTTTAEKKQAAEVEQKKDTKAAGKKGKK